MSTKRVLIYTNHFYPENFKVNEIASMLATEDFEVTVITGLPNYPAGKIYEGYGIFKKSDNYSGTVTVKRLPLIPRGSGRKFRLVINYLSYFISCLFYTLYIALCKRKYDIVFVHHTSPVLIAFPPVIYKWIRGAKLILWDLDMWPDTLVAMKIISSKRLISILENLIGWLYRRYDTILIGSKSFKQNAETRVKSGKVAYFPNWAETVFTQRKDKPDSLEISFPPVFKVMYAGNIGEAQDFESITQAMILLKDEPIAWLLVGDGRHRKELEIEIIKNNLQEKVHFYGNHPLESMPFFFSQADVLFFSLKDEEIFSKTVPAKLQAYMAFGKPVVGMISGEGNAIIKEANCGLAVESGDFIGFANAIMQLKEGEQKDLEYFSKNGQAYYEANFSLKSRKAQLMELFKNGK